MLGVPRSISVAAIIDHQPAANAHAVANCTATALSINGTFATDTGWTLGGTWAIAGGVLARTEPAGENQAYHSASSTADIYHYATYTVANRTAGIVTFVTTNANWRGRNTNATFGEWFRMDATDTIVGFKSSTFAGDIDDFTVERFDATAQAAGSRDIIDWIAYSYDTAPTAGSGVLAIVKEDGSHLWSHFITAAGSGFVKFPIGKFADDGDGLGVVLTAGGAGVTGKLAVGMR